MGLVCFLCNPVQTMNIKCASCKETSGNLSVGVRWVLTLCPPSVLGAGDGEGNTRDYLPCLRGADHEYKSGR